MKVSRLKQTKNVMLKIRKTEEILIMCNIDVNLKKLTNNVHALSLRGERLKRRLLNPARRQKRFVLCS